MNTVALLFCFGISFISVAVISFSQGFNKGYKDGFKDMLDVIEKSLQTNERHEDGDWVKYKDYKYLEDEHNRLLDSIKRISEYYKNE